MSGFFIFWLVSGIVFASVNITFNRITNSNITRGGAIAFIVITIFPLVNFIAAIISVVYFMTHLAIIGWFDESLFKDKK